MRKTLVGLLLLSGIFAASADSGVLDPVDFFDEKVEFTVSGYKGSGTLSNFPVLIRLSSAIKGFDYGRCDRDTVRFTDSDGNLLPFEIDTWDTSGTSCIWVGVPELKDDNTTVVMYYGGNGGMYSRETGSVWTPAGYRSVWHMNIAGNDTSDSAADNTASVLNPNQYCGAGAGLIGGGYFCEENKTVHALEAPGSASASFAPTAANTLTYTAWVRQIGGSTANTAPSGYPQIQWGEWGNCGTIWHTGANNGNPGTGIGFGVESGKSNDSSAFALFDASLNIRPAVADIYDGDWHQVVTRYDGGALTIWVDGQKKYSTSGSYTAPAASSMVYMGARINSNHDCVWTGGLDEMRFRDAASSDDWIAAEYANVTDSDFVRNSGAEQLDSGRVLPTVVKLTIPAQEHMSLVSVTYDGRNAVQDETGAWSVLSGSTVTATFMASTGYELTGNPVQVTVGPDAEQTLTVFPTATAIVLPDDGVTLKKVKDYEFSVDGCGGIAYSGKDNLFYVLRDHADDGDWMSKVYPLTLGIDLDTGAITSQTLGTPFTPGSNRDSEGIAYDSASGKLWISDEYGPTIAEFGLDGTASGRTAPVPDIQRLRMREGRSLESLTLSPDGLTMWTANEQSLLCDGAPSDGSTTVATVVRLTRFTRAEVAGAWTADGQWAYACDPCAGTSSSQSGVSGLCALPDGSLLVLEREVSTVTMGRCRIYRVTPYALSMATDVTGYPALEGAVYTGVSKGAALVDFSCGLNFIAALLGQILPIYVYEGITLGPKLSDGSRSVYLVSDGGEEKTASRATARTSSLLCALKLSGLAESGDEPGEWDVAGTTGGITGFDNGKGGRCVSFKKVALTGGRLKVDFDAGKIAGDGQKFVLVCKDSLTSAQTFTIEATLTCDGEKKGVLETDALAALTGKQQLFIVGIGAVK